MRMNSRILPALLLAALTSCLSESGADLSTPSTFVRYYNGGLNDEARDLIRTNDGGLLILANTEIPSEDGLTSLYKIKVIKTDAYGKQEWKGLYPEDFASTVSYKGNGIATRANGGYIITGEVIQGQSTKLMLLQINSDGTPVISGGLGSIVDLPSAGTASVSGIAAVESGTETFALGRISGLENDNMILTSVTLTTTGATRNWDKAYGAGDGTLINKLFVQDGSTKDLVWGGTVERTGSKTNIRFVQSPPNSYLSGFDLPIGEPDADETANGMCVSGSGYAMIGTTNKAGNNDVLFVRLTSRGSILSSKSFPVQVDIDGVLTDIQQDEIGNSLSSTRDGGFILLGTVPSVADYGRGGTDFLLIKIDAFGNEEWKVPLGSSVDDVGVSVLQAADDGYIILGTTDLANIKTLALIKTDKNGKIK